MINKVFQLVSNNIASCIIVNSKCVDGLSKGNLLFSAKNIKKKIIDKNHIMIIFHKSSVFWKNEDMSDKFIFQPENTTNHVIIKITNGSLTNKTNHSLAAHNHQKYVALSIQYNIKNIDHNHKMWNNTIIFISNELAADVIGTKNKNNKATENIIIGQTKDIKETNSDLEFSFFNNLLKS